MWMLVILFNIVAVAVVVPALRNEKERRFIGDLRSVPAGFEADEDEPPAAAVERRRKDALEDARAMAIYLSWLTKREALRA